MPGLDIEIVHRVSPNRDEEQIAIRLQATPSFEAFGRWLESANPFVFWMQAAQLFWSPWLDMAHAVPHSGGRPLARRGVEPAPEEPR